MWIIQILKLKDKYIFTWELQTGDGKITLKAGQDFDSSHVENLLKTSNFEERF